MAGMHWLGPRADVADILADLDVFVAPSTKPEPFGMVILEALAAGVPVVATDAGGPREIMAGAAPEVGRLVPPGDAPALAAAVLDLLAGTASSTAKRRPRDALHSALRFRVNRRGPRCSKTSARCGVLIETGEPGAHTPPT